MRRQAGEGHGVGGCGYRTKHSVTLTQNIDVVWRDCLELGCEFRTKQKGNLKVHRADVHDIGLTWLDCPEPNCSYKAKQKSSIKVHGVGVTWHACTELGCEYKAKK